jgi:Phytanoyl-CoA dioxygenase (PhyH)
MTVALDRRTHRDADVQSISPDVFFTEQFPALARANGGLVVEAMNQLGAPPLSIEVGDSIWSIVAQHDALHAVNGAAADAMVVTFTPAEFSDWCQNQRSLNSFAVARVLRMRDATTGELSIWDSLTMTLLYGWPTVGTVIFADRHGDPLDLSRCFTPGDDPADIAHFLREAGFLHLRGWVDVEAMPLISADMEQARPTYVEGDGKSWWAQRADGTRVCVRMQEFVEHSPSTAAMLSSQRWDQLRLTLAAGDQLDKPVVEGRCIEALFKPVGVVSGPSDLTFHRDCHLGRHAYGCSAITVGVSLTPSGADNGLLRVIPGSHRIAVPVEIAKTNPYLEPLALPTEQGDLTVHLSCTLHEATAPQHAERRVMYTGFSLTAGDDAPSTGSTQLAELREQVTNILRESPAPIEH